MKNSSFVAWRLLPSTLPVFIAVIWSASTDFIFAQNYNGAEDADEEVCFTLSFTSTDITCNGAMDGTAQYTINKDNASCPCPSVTKLECVLADGSNSETITIDPPGNTTISFPQTIDFTGLEPGNYTLTLEANDNNNCTHTSISTVTITEPDAISITTQAVTPSTSCSGNGSFQIKAEGGTPPYSFAIPNNTITGVPTNTLRTFSNLKPGNYVATVTDANGCMGTSNPITIGGTSNAPFVVTNVMITPVTCNGGGNGAVSFTVTGGGGISYSYNGLATPSFSNLTMGEFQVMVVASPSLCDTLLKFNIGGPPPINIVTTPTNVTCSGKKDGAISSNVSGGNSGSFTYLWSNSANTANISNLSPGNYSLTVTDSKGCTAKKENIAITEPGALDYTAQVISPIASGETASLVLEGNDDVQRFTWEITEQVNIATIQPSTLSGNTADNQETINKTVTIVSDRAPGAIVYQVFPVFSDACKGDTSFLTVVVVPNKADDPFIPEIYTPNGDGQNDIWQVALPDGAEGGDYAIYNRLGGKVMDGNVLTTPWDGSGCPDGTYFYILRYNVDGTEVVKKGAVTILRTTD